MKKNLAAALMLSICFLGGCSSLQSLQPSESLSVSNNDAQDILEETSEEQTNIIETQEELSSLIDKNDLQPPDLEKIHVSNAHQYCSREEYPSLYKEVQTLLLQRQQILNTILGVNYDKQLNMDETVTDEKGHIFYRFKEQRTLEDVRADLAMIYTDDYIDTDGAWYLTSLFHEEQGKLYRSGGDGWADGLYNNWVLRQINDINGADSYYIIGYMAIGAYDYDECHILSIWTITKTDEGFRICSEQDINFLQAIYVLPEDDFAYDSEID